MNEIPGLVLVVLILLAGCNSAAPTTVATPTPMPTLEPFVPTGAYDGVWVGITGQEKEIEVTVDGDVVTVLEFDVIMRGSGWEATWRQSRAVTIPLDDNVAVGDYEFADWTIEFNGSFHDAVLEGMLTVERRHPQGLGTAWTETAFTATRPEPGELAGR